MKCACLAAAVMATLAAGRPAQGQIVTDGSMGAALALTGPQFTIPETLGSRAGANLFHSFTDFNIAQGQSATFTGGAGIARVISRVTGARPSTINGTLRSTIAGADFYFLNPAGIMFGPSAAVSLPASLFLTTADEIHMAGGARFGAGRSTASVLSTAAPEAFGFINPAPRPINVDASRLFVRDGRTLSLAAGDIFMDASPFGQLRALGGTIDLLAVGGATVLGLGGATSTGGFKGRVDIADATNGFTDNVAVVTSGNGAGLIRVRGGSFFVEGAYLYSDNLGSIDHALAVDIAANVVAVSDGARITADTYTARGGTIRVVADQVFLFGFGNITTTSFDTGAGGAINVAARQIYLDSFGSIRAEALGTGSVGGAGGSITITAGEIFSTGGYVSTRSQGNGVGGSIDVTADTIVLDGAEGDAAIRATAEGFGPRAGAAGTIRVTAGELRLVDGGRIDSSTEGSGRGGNVAVKATSLSVTGPFSAITAGSNDDGAAGGIAVTADTLVIADGGQITAAGSGSGASGSVAIAGKSIAIDGANSAVLANSFGNGAAGAITVTADRIDVTGSARIDTSSTAAGSSGAISITAARMALDSGRITNGNFGAGAGGTVRLDVDDLRITRSGVVDSGTFGSGAGGSILVNARTIMLDGFLSGFSADTSGTGAGGSVLVTADSLVMTRQADLSSVSLGSGAGGAVSITARTVSLDGSRIGANAFGGALDAGPGGAITITADSLGLVNGGSIDTSSIGPGPGGTINIAVKTLSIDGAGSNVQSSSYGSERAGGGGAVNVTADTVRLTGSGQIATTTYGAGRGGSITVTAKTFTADGIISGLNARSVPGAAGEGGSIRVTAEDLNLTNGAQITSASDGSGAAGTIGINVGGMMRMDGATVEAKTEAANGGGIDIAARTLDLRGSSISSTVGGADGNAGNVTLQAGVLVLDDSTISANAFRGRGGNMSMAFEQLIRHPGRLAAITATSQLGISGDVSISTPGVDATSGVGALSVAFATPEDMLSTSCGAGAGQRSSLVSAGRSGVPDNGTAPSPGRYFAGPPLKAVGLSDRSASPASPAATNSQTSSVHCRGAWPPGFRR